MGNAIQACFSKYATFSGRATRSEYWYFELFYLIVLVVASIIDPTTSGVLSNLVFLVFIVPIVAAGCRRMHDVGKSGWFQIIPFYGLYLACQPSAGDNEYGPRP
jgi:uncharacterized membrane protein YhaH (DUF805 family)